jgi:hypothetical protein
MRIGRHERYSWADHRRCGCVCVDGRCNCVYRRHGGLTPPALGTRTTTVHRKNNDFGDAQTHVGKSGGRQPAVVWENRPGGDGSGFFDRLAPEHVTKPHCHDGSFPNRVCNRNKLPFRVSSSHPECTSRGAYAPRSCVGVRTSAGETTIFAMHRRTLTRAAGVSPPYKASKSAGDFFQRSSFGVVVFVSGSR